jgi:hypothetical protein
MSIAEVLLRQKVFLLHKKSLQTLKFCCLISMDHKGSVSLLIFSLGFNRFLAAHTQQQTNSTTSCDFSQRLNRDSGQDYWMSYILFFSISLFLETLEFPKCIRYFFFTETHCAFIFTRFPKSSQMSCYTTILEILDTFIISLVLVSKENMQEL